MFRRAIAGLFLGPALLIGSFAWSGFIALRTVFDEDRSSEIAQELFDNDEVRAQLAVNVGSAVEALLPDDVEVGRADVESATKAVLDDPRVEQLFVDAFSSTHHAFLGSGDVPRTLDLTVVAAMVRDRLVEAVPSLDDRLPESEPLVATLPTDQMPNAGPLRDLLRRSVPFLAAISLVGVLIALLATNDRERVLKRAARWAIGTSAMYLVIGLGIPALIRQFAPDQAKVVASLITALLRATLGPSIILAIVGAGLLVAAFVWPEGGRSRKTVAPAAAAPSRVPPVAADPRSAAAFAAPAAPPIAPVTPPPTAAIPQQSPTGPAPAPAPAPPTEPASSSTATPPSGPAMLPTRASMGEPVDLPAWTGEPAEAKYLPPRWIEGHGWVLDPDDQRPPPSNSRWVEGVGHVIPGPPPAE